ncbi:hypothetical protein DFH09DRAFT_1341254 [Mycena vulgaris]|nr:hypothetical protein DFH09DRAFT_1341254 [Mycena vulgaris]
MPGHLASLSARVGNGEQEMDEEETLRVRSTLVTEHSYPVSEHTQFDDAMYEFEVRHSESPRTRSLAEEWAMILALGAAEHNRDETAAARHMRLGHEMTVTTRLLGGSIGVLFDEAAKRAARTAASSSRDLEALPPIGSGTTEHVIDLRALALIHLEGAIGDAEVLDVYCKERITRLQALQSTLLDEICCRRDSVGSDEPDDNTEDNSSVDSAPSDTVGSPEEDADAESPPPPDFSAASDDSPPPGYYSPQPEHPHGPNAPLPTLADEQPSPRILSIDAVLEGFAAPSANVDTALLGNNEHLWSNLPSPTEELMDHPSMILGQEDTEVTEGYDEDQLRWIYGNGVLTDEDSPSSESSLDSENEVENQLQASDQSASDIGSEAGSEHSHSPGSQDADQNSDPENYDLVDARRPAPDPRADDELVIKSVVMLMGAESAEAYLTYKDHRGQLYVKVGPLPATHYLSADLQAQHTAAMNEAIHNRAEELGCTPARVRGMVACGEDSDGIRDRRGYRDTSPCLLPGVVFHERVTSEDPDEDDLDQYPGFRVHSLAAQRIEHLATVNRLDAMPRIGITDPPSRNIKDIACLTAELEIGGSKAYILFDSGSNVDSLTPEFTRSTHCKVFKLDDFGGIKGHTYYDIVNLDRYKGIIGTPFMIKHKLVLDFGKREIRFPNGHILAALSVMDDLLLVRRRLVIPTPGVPTVAPHN